MIGLKDLLEDIKHRCTDTDKKFFMYGEINGICTIIEVPSDIYNEIILIKQNLSSLVNFDEIKDLYNSLKAGKICNE